MTGAEVQEYLRENVVSQPGAGILTETFTCPESVTVGDGDTLRCDVSRQGRGFEAFEIYFLEIDGTLRLHMDVQ